MADRVIGVLGLLLSLPSFILLFAQQQTAVAALCLLIGLILIAEYFYIKYRNELPPFSMDCIRVTLTIHDKDGQRATICKHYQIKPNYAHLTRMSHRNIASDGSIANISWDDQPVAGHCIKEIMGERQVMIDFPHPLERNKLFEGKLSYDVLDSFPSIDEGLVYVVDFRCKKVELTVVLPPDRPCKSTSAFQVRGAGLVKSKSAPQIANGNREIRLSLKRPAVGSEFELHWKW